MKKFLFLSIIVACAAVSVLQAQNCTTPPFKKVEATSAANCTVICTVPQGSATCGAIYIEVVPGSGVYLSRNTSPYANPANPAFIMHYDTNPSKTYMDADITKAYVIGANTYQLKTGTKFYFTGYCTDGTETAPSPIYELKFKGH